jgi:hypothetical protein
MVTNMLVQRGVVPDKHQAARLYKSDIRQYLEMGTKYKRMQIDDFMNLFNKRMFVSALLQVTKLIENTGGTSKPGESRKGSKEVSRVSSASQLTREEKKREELVRKDYLKEIPLVLKINQFER